MRPMTVAKIARLSEVEPVSFGPLAQYRKLTGDDGLPVFTGVQTCAPGYSTPLHWHPYAEYLFILEGTMEAWTEGNEGSPARLGAGEAGVDLVELVLEKLEPLGPQHLRAQIQQQRHQHRSRQHGGHQAKGGDRQAQP